jgi:flagellar export protein FliJ
MKPFKFTLQAVRTVREREEQSALREYVATLRALEEAKRRYEAVEEQILMAWDDFRQALQTDSSSVEITRVQDDCEMLQERRRELESALQAARQKANRAFTRYLAAHQACALVEQCVQNQSHRHEHERPKRQQKGIDDLAQRSLSLANLICRSRGTIWN